MPWTFFPLLGSVFLIGTGFLVLLIGLIMRSGTTKKISAFIIIAPILFWVSLFLFSKIQSFILHTPDKLELIGVYEPDSQSLNKMKLNKVWNGPCKIELQDSFFNTENFEINGSTMQAGTWNYDPNEENNELTFDVGNITTCAHIYRTLSDFKIEFFNGDPDGAEGIFFHKVKH